MQPSEDRHDEGRERLGIPQRRRVPLLVRDDRHAHPRSRTGVFATGCGSRIFMQPSEDRRGEGRGRPGIQQRCWAPLLVRDDRPARRYSRIGVFAKDGSN